MQIAPYNREQVAQRALASEINIPGFCQGWTREKAGAPSAGDYDGDGAADAEDGWKMEPAAYKHPGDRKPPKGTIVSYLGGSHDNGHRAVSLGPNKNGLYEIRTTDGNGSGRVATRPLDWPEKTWGLTYVGWSDTCDGWLIPHAPASGHPAKPEIKTDYHWYQPGVINSASSGCAMGVRKSFGSLVNTRHSVGSRATKEGGGIRQRSILRGRVVVKDAPLAFSAAAGHAPPPRAPIARAAFMKVFSSVKARFKGGDLNLAQRAVQRVLARRVIGEGVLWLVLPRTGFKILSWRAVSVGGDHKAILVRVKHKKTGIVIRFLVINCMSVSTNAEHAKEIMTNGLTLHPHVVFASECSDFRAALVDAQS